MSSIERFARRLERQERAVRDGATQPRLPHSSIDNGFIELRDIYGNVVGQIGRQYDGTHTAAALGGTWPTSPTMPLVTPIQGGLRLYWDGTYIDGSPTRMDFRRVTFHAVTDMEDLDILSPSQIVGEITIATGGEVTVSLPPVEHFVVAVAWTESGKFSVESDVAFGTPEPLVDVEQFNQLETDLATLNDTTLPALQGELDATEAEVATLRDTTIPALDGRLDAAEADVNTLQTVTLPALDGRLDAAEADVNTLQTVTLPALQGELDTAEGKISTLETVTIPALDGRLDAAEADVNTLQTVTLPALDGRLDAAEADVTTLQTTTIPALQGEIDAAEGRLTTAEGKVSTLETTTLPALDGRLDAAEADITAAEGRLTAAEGKVTTLETTTLPALQDELDASQAELATVKDTTIPGLQDDLDEAALEVAKLASKGTDLVINGTGSMGDNTNFSLFTFDPTDAPVGAGGSFVSVMGSSGTRLADQFIPVNPDKRFRFSYQVRQRSATATDSRFYGCAVPFDGYGQQISPSMYMYEPGTLTTLAAPLNPGDTTITLTSSANWYGTADKPAGSAAHYRNIIWWDYTDPGGKLWPELTYSRNTMADPFADGGIVGNVITLRAPYSGPAKPAGTKLSNGSSGGTYIYFGSNQLATSEWTAYSDSIQGINTTGNRSSTPALGWPAGTAACKIGWLPNRFEATSEMAFALVSFSDASAAYDAAIAVTETVDSWKTTGQTTIDGGAITADSIQGTKIKAKTISVEKLMIGSLENIIQDPTFKTPSPLGTTWSTGSGIIIGSGPARAGGVVLAFVNTATQQATYNLPQETPCEPGDVFNLSMWFRGIGAAVPAGGMSFGPRWKLSDGSFAYGGSALSPATPTGVWGRAQNLAIAPANTVSVSFYVASNGNFSTGYGQVDYVSATRASSGEMIVDGAIIASKIATDAVVAAKIAAGAVVAEKIAANAVTAIKIAADAVTAGKIAADAITAREIEAGTITALEIATGAITADELAADSVIAIKIAADAVVAGKIAADAISAREIQADAITASEIAANTITAAEIAANTITATQIAADAITTSELAAGAVTADEIAANAVTTIKLNAGAVVADKIATDAVTAIKIQADAVTAGKIAADAITAREIEAGTITATEIAANTITADEIAADAITTAELAAGAVTAMEIAADAVTAIKIQADAVTAGKIAADAITAREIEADTITANEIAAGTITALEIATGAITADELAANAVTATKIAAGAISARLISGDTIETNVTAARGIKLNSSTLSAYSNSGVRTFNIDGVTGNVEMTGTLKSGSTVTGATIESLNGVTGAKAILSSGLLSMFSNFAGEVASGGLSAGSWTFPNGVSAAQTLLESPRISASAAAKVRLWQSPNGATGAELYAGDNVRLQVDQVDGALWGHSDRVIFEKHVSQGVGGRNTEVKFRTDLLTLDVPPENVWIGGKQVNFNNPIDWRHWQVMAPTNTYVGSGAGWMQIHSATNFTWPANARYAHVSVNTHAVAGSSAVVDVHYSLKYWTNTRPAAQEICYGYNHNGGRMDSQMGTQLDGWIYAPAYNLGNQLFHFAVEAAAGGSGGVGIRHTVIMMTFFS